MGKAVPQNSFLCSPFQQLTLPLLPHFQNEPLEVPYKFKMVSTMNNHLLSRIHKSLCSTSHDKQGGNGKCKKRVQDHLLPKLQSLQSSPSLSFPSFSVPFPLTCMTEFKVISASTPAQNEVSPTQTPPHSSHAVPPEKRR